MSDTENVAKTLRHIEVLLSRASSFTVKARAGIREVEPLGPYHVYEPDGSWAILIVGKDRK